MAEERRRWCEDVRAQWARKRLKLNEGSYSRFDENWLLVWDNVGLGDDVATLLSIQDDVKRTAWFDQEKTEFDHVYVLSGDYTFDFIPGKFMVSHERAEEINAWLGRAPSS